MKKLTTILLSTFAFAVLLLGIPASAATKCDAPENKDLPVCQAQQGSNATTKEAGRTDLNVQLKTIVNILLFVLGAIAVIMIVVGGIRYTTSNGESAAITGAKNTILYAVVGLIVAILAYSIVNFVLDAF